MRAAEPVFEGVDYEVVAWAHGLEPVFFRLPLGQEQRWLLVAKGWPDYLVFAGTFDCRPDHDAFGRWRQEIGPLPITRELALVFAADYAPVARYPPPTVRRHVEWGAVARLLVPAFVPTGRYWPPEDHAVVAADCALALAFAEDLAIRLDDILHAGDPALRRRALRRFGPARFLAEVDARTLDAVGADRLLEIGRRRLLWTRDPRTGEPEPLPLSRRVRTVRDARAWVHGLDARDLGPLVE